MIFDNNYGLDCGINESAIEPSKYDLGFGGALMHVYENQCNFNSMMKAVGLSELKYYNETGKDLFLNEAGAFSSFIEKAKSLFKKIIEKIKSIFKKFFMVINSKAMDDKTFVKKYEKDLMRRILTDFEFEGYPFPKGYYAGIDKTNIDKFNLISTFEGSLEKANKISNIAGGWTSKADSPAQTLTVLDSDALSNKKDEQRASVLGETGSMDMEEFKDKAFEILYGSDSKETLEAGKDFTMREVLDKIKNAETAIRVAKKVESKTTKAIDDYIKALDKAAKNFIPTAKAGDTVDYNGSPATLAGAGAIKAENEARDLAIKIINQDIELAQSQSNDVTVLCGMMVKAIQDERNQCKAICIKAINYKHESVNYSGYSEGADYGLFDDVVIR